MTEYLIFFILVEKMCVNQVMGGVCQQSAYPKDREVLF